MICVDELAICDCSDPTWPISSASARSKAVYSERLVRPLSSSCFLRSISSRTIVS